MSILQDSNIVVAIACFLFLALLWKLGVHTKLNSALDARAAKIREELDEARRLREEAQALLASYERKQKEVQGQVSDIVAHAKGEAEAAAVQAKADLEVAIERRLRGADEQIASAEAAAVREVRDEAIAVAVSAAREVIAGATTDAARAKLVDESIATVGARLN